mmetsp:Transcript_15213/g.35213  ORF Transcript_15213/g.35213 Transcript_15213/m.35213 type:complete len:181 (-) Transcript_15213:101-643(-)
MEVRVLYEEGQGQGQAYVMTRFRATANADPSLPPSLPPSLLLLLRLPSTMANSKVHDSRLPVGACRCPQCWSPSKKVLKTPTKSKTKTKKGAGAGAGAGAGNRTGKGEARCAEPSPANVASPDIDGAAAVTSSVTTPERPISKAGLAAEARRDGKMLAPATPPPVPPPPPPPPPPPQPLI